MKTFSVVITDLDNTLFDWVDIWHRTFKAMLDQLVKESGVLEETLLPEFKKIHEEHRTSEYAFSIEELPSLKRKYPQEDLVKKFDSAIKAFRVARKDALRLYPTVMETLQELKDKGCLLVGYTESMSYYTNYRMRNLDLDRILDVLYSPPDHELPGGAAPEEIRRYPEDHYKLRRTVHEYVGKDELKPNPKVLLHILKSIGAVPEQAVYVGDSLMKDVLMAKQAGVTDVWAKYGTAQNRPEYELLRRVTHWTKEDVEREKKLSAQDVKPTHVLESTFGELLKTFNFTRFQKARGGECSDSPLTPLKEATEMDSPSQERLSQVVDVWKETIDVQQHFNDLELRIRNYAVTILAAVLGLTAYGIKDATEVHILGLRTSLASAILIAAIVPWLAFYFMDRFHYHPLLYGAVKHGESIEDRWKGILPELSLTTSISKYSPLTIGKWKVHSPRKISLFYLLGVLLLGLMAYFMHPKSNPPIQGVPVSNWLC